MHHLPVRSGADARLADAFGRPGCPLCRERERLEARQIGSILDESVNDVGFRRALDAARGFCGRHSRAISVADRRINGGLGAAILLRAVLRIRLAELEAAHGAGSLARSRRMAEGVKPAACPICARVASVDRTLVDGLVRLCEDGAWAEATATAPFCLEHVAALMDRRSPPAWWLPVEARQLARLADLRDRLDGYAHTSAEDRRHLRTDAQRRSVDEAEAILGGGTADEPPAS